MLGREGRGQGSGQRRRGDLYSEGQYIMVNGHMEPPPSGQTDMSENIKIIRSKKKRTNDTT